MDSVHIQGYGDTDIGQNRLINEDYFDMNESLFVLADGMGGHNAGEVASRLAVNHLFEFFKRGKYSKDSESINELQIQKNIIEGIKQTNQLIYQSSTQKTAWNGMGTTIVLAFFQKPNTIHIANVGDSRADLIRNGKLKRITEDHSITASLVRDGTITPTEAKTHPYRHHLTRSMGTSNTVKPYITHFQIRPNDKILLCSDGLWDVLSEKEINDVIQHNPDPKTSCKTLIKKAKKKQSTDNISCLIITISRK